MTNNASKDEVAALIHSTDTFTIVSHYNPDADAYGSSLGVAHALRAIGKTVTVINETGILPRYEVIPGVEEISQTIKEPTTLLVICDCGSMERIGASFKPWVGKFKTIVNIDHHISNDYFGGVNFIDATASSTSEIIYDLLEHAKIPVPKKSAEALLAGIIGDTGSFRYSCTTAKTMRVAAALMDVGASPTLIYQKLFGETPVGKLKLQSEAMLNVQFHCEGKYAEVIVNQDMIARLGATLEDADGLVEKARDIEGVVISSAIRQDGGLWRVSLRSISSKYNVSDIAATFGGGGHVEAAAFRSTKSLEKVRAELLKKIEAAL